MDLTRYQRLLGACALVSAGCGATGPADMRNSLTRGASSSGARDAAPPSCGVGSRQLPTGWTWVGAAAPASPDSGTNVSAAPGSVVTISHGAAGTLSGPQVPEALACAEFKAKLADDKGPSVLALKGDCSPFDVRRSNVTIIGVEGARVTCDKQGDGSACTARHDAELVHVQPDPEKEGSSAIENVAIIGLTFEGFRTSTPADDAIAISVKGAHNVLIAGNTVKNGGVAWKAAYDALKPEEKANWTTTAEIKPEPPETMRIPKHFNASAFRISGGTSTVVFGNKIAEMKLGYSEAVALVDGSSDFRLLGNILQGIDNIGIDVRGDEGGISRDGAICFNSLSDFVCGDPSYGHPDSDACPTGPPAEYDRSRRYPNAGGIYVDGAQAVRIEANRVDGWNYGVQVSAEEAVEAPRGVWIVNNTLMNNQDAEIHLGHRGDDRAGVDDEPGDCGTVVTHPSAVAVPVTKEGDRLLARGVYAENVARYGCACAPRINGAVPPGVCRR